MGVLPSTIPYHIRVIAVAVARRPRALSQLAVQQDLLMLLSAERVRAAGVLELLGRQMWANFGISQI